MGKRTDLIGAWAETVAAAHFMMLGWDVFMSLNPGSSIDLVIIKDGNIRYLDVKYRRSHRPSGRKLTEEQVSLGVELVHVKDNGVVIEARRKLEGSSEESLVFTSYRSRRSLHGDGDGDESPTL